MNVIIVGGGKVGIYIASLLISEGHNIKIIEDNEELYNRAKLDISEENLINKDATDPSVLEYEGIEKVDVLAAVSDNDEKNLVVSTLAKMEFKVPKVIARVNNPKNAWLYNEGMGVDVKVDQADIIGHLIIEEMNLDHMLTLMKLNRGKHSIIQINIKENSKAIGKLVKEINIPSQSVLISLTRNGIMQIPKGNTTIEENDEILILTDDEGFDILEEIF